MINRRCAPGRDSYRYLFDGREPLSPRPLPTAASHSAFRVMVSALLLQRFHQDLEREALRADFVAAVGDSLPQLFDASLASDGLRVGAEGRLGRLLS